MVAMDSLLQQFSTLLLIFFLSLVFLWIAVVTKGRSRKLGFPPGPCPLPIIGNMLMMDQLTHRGLAKLADRYGGLVYLRLGRLHTVAVSTPQMAKEILQVQDNKFASRPANNTIRYLTYDRADMVFAVYGPFWRQMRKLCVMKLFSRKRAESWASVRDEVESTLCIVAGKAGTPVNLGELVFNLNKNIIYRAAFGSNSHEGQDEFVSIMQEFSKLFGAFNIGDFYPQLQWFDPQGLNKRLVKARESLDRFIDIIIDDHMSKKEKRSEDEDTDMIDDLLAYHSDAAPNAKGGEGESDDIKLTRKNIKAIIMDVMFGGTETVALVIEWVMAEMMKRPEELKKVQVELVEVVGLDRKVHETDLDKLNYLKCTMKETLRLHPPIPLLLHEPIEDCVVGGYSIPAGTRVMVNAWAIGRDKTEWEDADTFKPSRFTQEGARDFKGAHFEFIPFGSGRRSCPGMQLGLYALELCVAQLLHCFNWTLPDGMKPSELDMNDMYGLTAPKAVRLIVVPTPRLHCPLF